MWGNATTEEDSKACITRFENLLNTSHRSCILPTTLCAVCSCNSSNKHTHTIAIKDLPGLHLLDASLPKTREEPRAAHTTFSYASKTYCLQPLAIHNNIVSVCSTCLDHLSTKKDSPMDSLVRIDIGAPPQNCTRTRVYKLYPFFFPFPFFGGLLK